MQKNTGKQKLNSLATEFFKTRYSSLCKIRKYEVLDDSDSPVTSSSTIHSFLYLSERSDSSKLALNYNTEIGSTLAKIFTFKIKATTNRDPLAVQSVKIVLGCFDQKTIKVEYQNSASITYDFISDG